VLCAFNFADDDVSVTISGIGPSGAVVTDARGGSTVATVGDDEALQLTQPSMSWHWLTVS
jgi:hypothetical protein